MASVPEYRVASRVAAVVALLFGALTIIAGGRVLFGGEVARDAAGEVVPFVLWFNFAAGFAYIAAGVALLMRSRWAAWLCALIAGATIAVFLAFGVHALSGGAYEMRTVGAMSLRCLVWIGIAILAWRIRSSETA